MAEATAVTRTRFHKNTRNITLGGPFFGLFTCQSVCPEKKIRKLRSDMILVHSH